VCGGGYLKLVPDTLHALPTAASLREQAHPAWDADWSKLRFVAMLQCNNKTCMEAITLAGTGRIEVVQTEADNQECIEFYTPEFFKPSPNLIVIPKECPTEVVDQLHLAFVSSWSDASASANHIRIAVERLLDFIKQPKTRLLFKGKRELLTLHKRIEGLASRDKPLSDSLLAVKWLGNAGSHSDVLTRNEVFDALDILEAALDELFTKKGKVLKALVKKINQKKGPVRKK
jgi:hypothetical protein